MKHIAIIADGNRRWAKQNNLPSELGYVQGLVCIENVCQAAKIHNIENLSFFCFSTENWFREQKEIDAIFTLAEQYFIDKKDWYLQQNIKVSFRGGENRIPSNLLKAMQDLETLTQYCTGLNLFIMVDYGGKWDIIQAFQSGARTEEEIEEYFNHFAPNPEIIIRTGGNHRLSNFMLWQAAYSEIYFLDILFPDFSEEELQKILYNYKTVQKNYGR